MALHANELLGYHLGEYQLERILGSGGTGIVFLATRVIDPDEQAAIKVFMPPTLNEREQDEFRQRFQREIEILSTLRHDHIVPVLGVGVDEPHQFTYIIMPYISGGTLAERLENGPLPFAQMMGYITQLADALEYAHEHHIIHRDLKPANVLLDEHDQVYLADFGIAKLLIQDARTITNANQVIGTPGYMAPEQVTGQMASAATDIYGLGILAYQMLTNRLPFEASSLVTTLLQIVSEPPASPREFRADLPQPAAEVILRAIAKMPEQRFDSATAFARALERGLQNKPMTPSPQTILGYMQASEGDLRQPDASPATWILPNQQRRRSLWGVMAACGLILVILVGIAGIRVLPRFGQLSALRETPVPSQPAVMVTGTVQNTPGASTTPLPTTSPTSNNSATGTPSSGGPSAGGNPSTTPHPTAIPTPTATPFPPQKAIVSNLITVTMAYNVSVSPAGCFFDSTVDPILTNRGAQTLNWSATYVPSQGAPNTTVSFAPSSGTLAPNQSVAVILSGGIVPWNASMFASYSWNAGQVTETMVCPPNPLSGPVGLAPGNTRMHFS
jgi:serine/threonine protein kinase